MTAVDNSHYGQPTRATHSVGVTRQSRAAASTTNGGGHQPHTETSVARELDAVTYLGAIIT
jgi:hypothetical protein